MCDARALQDALAAEDTGDALRHAGRLDLDGEEEIEQFFRTMTEGLVLDDGSVWRLAGHAEPLVQEIGHDSHDDGPHIIYENVDYEALRSRPKFQQYLHRFGSNGNYRPTPLQQILGAITDHFQGLHDAATQLEHRQQVMSSLSVAAAAETEEEAKELEEAQTRHQHELTSAQRHRVGRVINNFFHRFQAGMRSRRFQELIGPVAVGTNYAIFVHLLLRLLTRDWGEPEKVVDALVGASRLFWGDGTQPGYFQTLTPDQQRQVLMALREVRADAQVLVSAHVIMAIADGNSWRDRLFAARDTTRALLSQMPFPVTNHLLNHMQHLAAELQPTKPATCTDIVQSIVHLVHFTTPTATLRELEGLSNAPRGAFTFKRQSTYKRGSRDEREEVECLVVPSGSLSTDQAALELLCEWRTLEPPGAREEYRLMIGEDSWGFYDVVEGRGRYRSLDRSVERGTIDALASLVQPWDATVVTLEAVARSTDANINAQL